MKWLKVPVGPETDQPYLKKVKVDGKAVCIICHDGKLYATSAWCPHAGADLSYGFISKDGNLVCPVHRFCYNLENGRGCEGQGDYLENYPVKIKDNEVYIGITGFWERVMQGFK